MSEHSSLPTEPQSLAELLAQLNAQGVHDHRRYSAVRSFLSFRARDKAIPLSGSFELTPLCNLDCKMCYVHLDKAQLQGAQIMNAEEWKSIMKQAVDAGMMYANLTGGECLTHPGFRELYLYLHSFGVEISLLSNGILMDGQMCAFLKEHPPARVQISLYGASEEAYARVTGHRRFRAVFENILRLQDAGIPVSVAVTPNAFMEDGEEIIRLLHENGLSFAVNSGILAPRPETGRKVHDASLDSYIAMSRLRRKLNGSEPSQESDPDSLPDPGGHGERRCGVKCGAGRSSFSVSWRGGMRPCNTFPCDEEDVSALGFAEAWRRTNAKALSYPLPAECNGCSYESICKHCVSEHSAGAEQGHASPAICAWAQRMAAEGLLKLEK